MPSTVEERKEIRRVLQRLSPKNVERLRNYAVHLELEEIEEEEPPLTPDEEQVIAHGATEPPFSGRYWNHKADGTYACRRCGATLYRSGDKFDSGCGWPSFDDAVPGSVLRRPDPDGHRTEIVCAACGAHLGQIGRAHV